MNILIITGGFFPGKKFGGPPVSIDNFCSLMKEKNDCYIITLDHDLFEHERYNDIKEGWNDRGNCKVLYLNDKMYKKESFEKIMDDLNPDILYLQGFFQSCILPCLQLARMKKIKVLLAPRGELCDGALMSNKKKYKKFIYIYYLRINKLISNIHFQSTSEEETEAIKKRLAIPLEKIHFLDNIPSLPVKVFPRTVKISGKGRFVFLSRIHPKKNLLTAIKFFQSIKGEAIFDIYGPIEDKAYWNECKVSISKLPNNVKVNYKGLVEHNRVHEIFSQYDAFIFPTLSENYGHVIAESLTVGTPVIISDQTPWTDINDTGVGGSYKLSDYDSFCNCINSIIFKTQEEMDTDNLVIRKYIKQKLNIPKIYQQYIDVLNMEM